ncbi:hypothetical protein [Mycobacterium lacus]|uniref:Lipoprotein n=1 Tax=Mycobacterium lacus TaxID=169765 RepID=A0A7I7NM93_9MYCO|nr:hypothetical protein [Mycobacterium lacus]MCV7122574.1 hypothetical protein [Mycobacterium lacus]BBX97714.1 hypothetical protein MLAC_30080 [Mycobacterium lacus]
MTTKKSSKARTVGMVAAALIAAFATLATGCAAKIPQVPSPEMGVPR